jgi:phytoene dehydrogenase-like protein
VDIVQRDDLSPDGDPASIHRNPAQVRMTGTRLSPDEAQKLARMLNTAAALIISAAARDQPRRNWGGGWNGGYGLAPVNSGSTPVHPQRRSA